MKTRIGILAFAAALAATAAEKPQMCVYRGPAPVGPRERNAAYAAWLGLPAVWGEDFQPREDWDNVRGGGWQLRPWSEWKKAAPGRRFVLTVSILPGAWDLSGPKRGIDAGKAVSLEAGARGDYNEHYKALAENLIKAELGDTILRLGHEMNGGWYAWRAKGHEEAFAGYFRQIVKTMRAVPGAELKFDFNPNCGYGQFPADKAWPGDEYVDFVGVDVYDQSWLPETYPIPAGASAEEIGKRQKKVRNDLLNGNRGLLFWRDFAKAHGKPLSLPEWGVWKRPDGHGGGDDPHFIEQMHAFITDPANNVAYHCYFDFTGGESNHRLSPEPDGAAVTEFPKSAARFKELFGAKGRCAEQRRPPNIVIILTDDQGFGELGATGNPLVRTPHMDRLAAQSASLVNFHVMPVCSPTRACLMTGRYNYRTGITDTYLGRSLMHPDEATLAEMLATAGYRTGIFGKWHLGDNYPMRAMDKGFQESLVLNGGGLAQPGDAPDPVDERGAYFNATLRHNGKWVKTKGYVSDVLTDAAVQFIQEKNDRAFFVYLPFNCPHSPHQVPEEYRRHYRAEDFAAAKFPQQGYPMAAKYDPDDLARVYGMIENIDDNVGRLLGKLDELKLTDNTIVVLFSDNGCQKHNGYNAGFQGWKGTTYEGGIHQFCFIRWPAQLKAGHKVDRIAAHIDLAPTLLELCGVAKPDRVKFDGLSLARLLRGEPVEWPDRTLFFQWHRGDAPERYRGCAARSQDWKLVQTLGTGEKWDGKTNFQLYDMAHDPLESHDLAAQMPDRVAELKARYEAWFNDVTAARDYSVPARIFLGAPQEDPVLLTRQDWRGRNASWGPKGVGYWEVNVIKPVRYDIKLRFEPLKAGGEATFSCGSASALQAVKAGAAECVFAKVELAQGPGRLEAAIVEGPATSGVKYVELKRAD